MKKKLRIMSYALGIVMMIMAITSLFPFIASAAEKKIDITGKYYEFYDDGSKYEISSTTPVQKMEHGTLGTVSVKGTINNTFTKNNVPAYEIADDELLSIQFSYDDTLLNADEKEWHLYEDGKKEIDGISLNEKIGYGAIIFQTSLDGKRWVTNYKETNIKDDVIFDKDNYINDIQLVNGCYYRIILAYKTRMKADPNNVKFIVWDTPFKFSNNIDLKTAEVYEFYASYKNAKDSIPDNIETFNLGIKQAVVTDNGFSQNIGMDSDDPHLGWDLGQFVMSGFTDNKTNNSGSTVFLKNVGDKITLWFNMNDNIDINKLNNNSHLIINNDTNGYDQNLNVPMQDFGHGALIVRFTDYKGKVHDPIIYTNFLEALAYPGANTTIQLFEEGDYEVSLDYEIKNDKGFGKLYNYKITFNFQIRNSNTIVYPKDKLTGSYLANDSITENGFVLDWAKSRYLDINVKLSQWTKGANGYTEDIVFNGAAKESDVYDKTGIYTITVTNPTTDPYGNNPTTKRIYVGSDNVLIASMNAKNSSYSINDISNMVDNEGYEITDEGELIPPVITEPVTEATSIETSESTTQAISTTTAPITSKSTTITESSATDEVVAAAVYEVEENNNSKFPVVFICLGSVVTVTVAVIAYKKIKSKQS